MGIPINDCHGISFILSCFGSEKTHKSSRNPVSFVPSNSSFKNWHFDAISTEFDYVFRVDCKYWKEFWEKCYLPFFAVLLKSHEFFPINRLLFEIDVVRRLKNLDRSDLREMKLDKSAVVDFVCFEVKMQGRCREEPVFFLLD